MAKLTKPCPLPRDWANLTYHPYAELVPFGAGVDHAAAVDHMKHIGYDDGEEVVIYNGQILDGRHRHHWAKLAGVTPAFVAFVGDDAAAFAYVLKKVLRQHLDTSQRAMIAAKLTGLRPGANQYGTAGVNATEVEGVQECATSAADKLNVSRRSVQNAKAVIDKGSATLQAAVEDGTLTVTDAAKVASEPKRTQNAAVNAVRSGKARTAAEATEPSERFICERCVRQRYTYPRRTCPACMAGPVAAPKDEPKAKAASKAKPDPKPVPAPVPARPAPVAVPVPNDAAITSTIRAAAKDLDGRAAALGEKQDARYAACLYALELLQTAWKAWRLDMPAPDLTPASKPQKPAAGEKCGTCGHRAGKGFVAPTIDDVRDYCLERGNKVDVEKWMSHYESNGWMVGRTKMKDWQAAVRTWEKSPFGTNGNGKAHADGNFDHLNAFVDRGEAE